MSNKTEELKTSFTNRTGTGEHVRVGEHLTPDQVTEFSDVFAGKLGQLSRKSELTKRETSFARYCADLGLRNLVWLVGREGTPRGQGFERHLARILSSAMAANSAVKDQTIGRRLAEGGGEVSSLLQATRDLTELMPFDTTRANFEDIGIHAFGALAAFAQEKGGMAVDQYLDGNLSALMTTYEQAELATV